MSPAAPCRILRVDLDTGSIRVDCRGESFLRKYMGGSCLGAHFLLEEVPPGTDPYSGDNLLIFATSPLTGARCPGANAHTVIAKSPLSGLIGEGVTPGGHFAVALKSAGCDALIIRGRARQPVYLYLRDGQVKIRDARSIWGKTTAAAYDHLAGELVDPETRIALIGPAGENLVRFASIVTDNRYFTPRFGLGAVMGSKRLKAVCVRGSDPLTFPDSRKIESLAMDFRQHFRENPLGRLQAAPAGEAGYLEAMVRQGLFCTRNFLGAEAPQVDRIDGQAIVRDYPTRNLDCYGCFGGCKKQISGVEAIGVDPRFGLIDIETLASCVSNLQVADAPDALRIWEAACQYGLDGTSLGGVLAFAIECSAAGLLSPADTGGRRLDWGDAEALLRMIRRIALREGIGNLLADGVKRASEKIVGSRRFAIHVKGVEVPCHEPRIKQMLGLGYAVSPIGPYFSVVEHDTDFDFEADPLYLRKVAPLGIHQQLKAESLAEQKVRMFYLLQPAGFSMLEALCCCLFAFSPVRYFNFHQLVELVNAATGWESSLLELWKLGEKRINLFKLFAVREGFGLADDMLPDRLFEPIGLGPRRGTAIDRDEFVKARALYYQMAGWDETGTPRRSKLLELDLLEEGLVEIPASISRP